MQHQIMFAAHDAGHRGITHNFFADSLIGLFIADFCCGLSIGWWKSSHDVHHLVTNHPVCSHSSRLHSPPYCLLAPLVLRPTNDGTGARPRYPERAPLRHMPNLPQISAFHLLRLHFHVEQDR